MKRLIILLLILFPLIISGCKTETIIKKPDFVLPEFPEREEIDTSFLTVGESFYMIVEGLEIPQHQKIKIQNYHYDKLSRLAEIINYYESLVQEWEDWGIKVKGLLTEQ